MPGVLPAESTSLRCDDENLANGNTKITVSCRARTMSDDPLSSGLLGGDTGTGDDNVEELNFEHPLHASDAAARLGMSTDAALMGGTTGDSSGVPAPAPTSMMAASTPALGGQPAPSAGAAAPAMNRQGSLFERIQAAQAAQGMPVSSSGPTPAGGPAMTGGNSTSNNLGQSQTEGGAVILEGSTTMGSGGGGGYDDNGPTLYASGPSIPQYQPEPSSGPYGGMMNDGLPEGASAGEKAMAVAGMAWEGMMRLGSKAARTGYRAVSQRGAEGGGNQAGLLGGGGTGAADAMESGGAAAPSYAPPGSEGTATMEGIGGGGNGAPQEGYSMVAYARQFVSDVARLISAAPAPVQYALILLVCYLFWKIFA